MTARNQKGDLRPTKTMFWRAIKLRHDLDSMTLEEAS
jgi:hypothetical protein